MLGKGSGLVGTGEVMRGGHNFPGAAIRLLLIQEMGCPCSPLLQRHCYSAVQVQ